MKKNYFLPLFMLAVCFSVNAQTTLFDQPVVGTSGIVSGFDNSTTFGTYSTDDFILDDNYIIQEINVPGFNNAGDVATLMTGLDVYIYADAMGLPSSDPSQAGTGLLEIINLPAGDASLTIADNDFSINVSAALGSDLVLPAGTYWLVVSVRVPDFNSRWNWFASDLGGNAHILDEGNFGASFSWATFIDIGLSFDSLAFSITGTPALSIDEASLSAISIQPNPAKDVINIENVDNLTSVELYSVLGKRVYKGIDERAIDISNLNTGVYLLKLTNETGTITKRIIKQ